MPINQARSNRKPSGARYKRQFVKRQHETGSRATLTRVDADSTKSTRTLGGNAKHKVLAAQTAHVVDKAGKISKVTITSVKENPANRHFIRRNIITKGAIIETSKGDAQVTSRPGQSGAVHAKLL